jgi:hypothetical protein
MAYLDKKNLLDDYNETKDHHRTSFDYFDEYERLARNRPSPKIAANLPKVTDGTLSAITQEQPKRVIQQVPTGKVRFDENPELAEISSYVLYEQLFPLGNTQGSTLQKSWVMLNKALTYGVSASYTYFTRTAEQFHTDFVIPYIKDVLIEKGKVFGPDSNKLFLRSWYTKSDLQGIIDREEKLTEKKKDYKSTWNLKKLAQLKDMGEAQSKEEDTPSEKEKGNQFGGYEIIHCFQKGVKSKFYSIAVYNQSKSKGKNTELIEKGDVVREWENPDPRGNMPIDFLYCDVDLSNPYGRGIIEKSGGIQNLLDHQMVMFQYISTMMMNPPLMTWGSVNKATVKYEPNAIWEMGQSQNNKIEPFNISNQTITSFPNNYGLLKSQILNMNSSLDTSVSAESGNPGFSKTPAGVEANNQRLSISDNYLRKQFEKWFGDEGETSLNIFFSEMEGKGELTLPPDQLSKLTEETAEKYLDKKKNVLKIPYGEINDKVFRFQVDASSSEVKARSDNAEKLTEALRISQNILNEAQKYKMVRQILKEIGVENLDKIFPEPESMAGQAEQKAQAEEQANMRQQQEALAGQQIANSPEAQPQEIIAGQALPPQQPMEQMPAEQPVADPESEQFMQLLAESGLPPEAIMQVEQMLQAGYNSDQILQTLGA